MNQSTGKIGAQPTLEPTAPWQLSLYPVPDQDGPYFQLEDIGLHSNEHPGQSWWLPLAPPIPSTVDHRFGPESHPLHIDYGHPCGDLPFNFESGFRFNPLDSLNAFNTAWDTFSGSSQAQSFGEHAATNSTQFDGLHAGPHALYDGNEDSWAKVFQQGQFQAFGTLLNAPSFGQSNTGLLAPIVQPLTQRSSKPFSCTYPGCTSKKGFTRKSELQRHMKKHSRSQAFPCPVAGCRFQSQEKAFYRADKLQSHIKSCHPRLLNSNGNGSMDDTQAGIQNSTHLATSAMTYNDPQRSSQE